MTKALRAYVGNHPHATFEEIQAWLATDACVVLTLR